MILVLALPVAVFLLGLLRARRRSAPGTRADTGADLSAAFVVVPTLGASLATLGLLLACDGDGGRAGSAGTADRTDVGTPAEDVRMDGPVRLGALRPHGLQP